MSTVDRGLAREEAISFPRPPADFRSRGFSIATALKFFGPGAIVASATIGSGESILASRLGATFGYAILWVVIVGALAKAALVYASNRYIVVTGEHPMARFADLFPGPRGWFPLLIGIVSVASFPTWSSGLAVALGDYLQQIGAGNDIVWAVGLLLVAGLVSFLGGYALLERVQVAIVGLLVVLVVVAVFVAVPDWGGVAAGFIPGPVDYQPFVGREYPDIAATAVWVEVVIFLGGLGGGMYDYVGYTGMMREKKWGMLGHRDIDAISDRVANLSPGQQVPLSERPQDVANARKWQRAPFGDMLIAFVALSIIAFAFIINGANILGGQQLVPANENVLTHQSEFLAAISPILEYFYVAAIFMVLFGTLYALWEIYSWTAYESFAAVSERVRRAGERRIRPLVYLYVAISALILISTGASFIVIVAPAAIVAGTLAAGIYSAGLLYADRVALPPQYRLGRTARAILVFSAVVLTFSGLIAFIQYLGLVG